MSGRRGFDEDKAKLEALDRALSTIEFAMDGTILTANRNFLTRMGYPLEEIRGRHHAFFMDPALAATPAYEAFWTRLRAGEYVSDEVMRLREDGNPIWLEATYNPIIDAHGKPTKVVKFVTDITQRKNEVSRLKTMIDKMPVAVMTADPKNEFKIDYMNATSRDTLGSIEQHLPIKVAEMLGTSFDVFHKNPQHQRAMLSDGRHLPHRTKIKLGPEVLELRVSAINGPEGAYVAPVLTRSIVTAHANMATEVQRVVEAVSVAVGEMQASAEGLSRSADEARDRANAVAGSSDQMMASIREISGQVGRVSERAQQIAAQAGATDATSPRTRARSMRWWA